MSDVIGNWVDKNFSDLRTTRTKRNAKRCTTHHFACDCGEYNTTLLAGMLREVNEILVCREGTKEHGSACVDVCTKPTLFCPPCKWRSNWEKELSK